MDLNLIFTFQYLNYRHLIVGYLFTVGTTSLIGKTYSSNQLHILFCVIADVLYVYIYIC